MLLLFVFFFAYVLALFSSRLGRINFFVLPCGLFHSVSEALINRLYVNNLNYKIDTAAKGIFFDKKEVCIKEDSLSALVLYVSKFPLRWL